VEASGTGSAMGGGDEHALKGCDWQPDPRAWVARCACGWQTGPRDFHEEALVDFRHHRMAWLGWRVILGRDGGTGSPA
jgi:hypothetical protein